MVAEGGVSAKQRGRDSALGRRTAWCPAHRWRRTLVDVGNAVVASSTAGIRRRNGSVESDTPVRLVSVRPLRLRTSRSRLPLTTPQGMIRASPRRIGNCPSGDLAPPRWQVRPPCRRGRSGPGSGPGGADGRRVSCSARHPRGTDGRGDRQVKAMILAGELARLTRPRRPDHARGRRRRLRLGRLPPGSRLPGSRLPGFPRRPPVRVGAFWHRLPLATPPSPTQCPTGAHPARSPWRNQGSGGR